MADEKIKITDYFTPDEGEEFLSIYTKLLRSQYESLRKDDVSKLKTIIQRIIQEDCFARDKNGINGLIRNVSTALIASEEIGLKRDPIIAMLLYRPAMKKALDSAEIKKEFGEEVLRILELLLKTSDLYARNTAINSENFHHLLFSFAEDVRVILIMIADRLFLMRSGKQLIENNERVRLSTEVSYLYAPLAHRLGLYKIKGELEDLSLKYLDPKQFSFIKNKLNETKRSRDAYIAEFIAPIEERLKKENLKFEIKGRTKSIYSINNKLKKQNIEFEGIYDLFAIRVVLDSPLKKERLECWQVYSIITDMYQPNPDRMKDWLSIPKKNGYESLHITVLGPQNRWVEVQIRTERMDEIAERGLAAHWKYKGVKADRNLDDLVNDVRAVLEDQNSSPMDLMKEFKLDLYKDEIYVFTPKGELINLPVGATVLDFAFSIHTKLGCSVISGKVNGKNVPIKQELKNGDSVEVVTSSSQIPKRDWLNFAVTSKARSKIKQSLREESAKVAEIAKETLTRRLKNRKIEVEESLLMRLIKKKGYKTITDFYVALGEERLDTNNFIEEYLEFGRKEKEAADTVETVSAEHFVSSNLEIEEETSKQDVLVIDQNLTGIEYKLGKCCNPIYGDDIFAYISTQGIKIHRMSCPNAPEIISRFGYRVIQARWSGKGTNGYIVSIRVTGNDDIHIVTGVTSVINKVSGATLRSINIDTQAGLFLGNFVVMIKDTATLTALLKHIRTLKGVKSAERIN